MFVPRVVLKAHPAELVATFGAYHVVTAIVFGYGYTAVRTWLSAPNLSKIREKSFKLLAD